MKNGMSFEKWMKAVDELLIKKCGLPSEDLPDCMWAQWYEDGITPRDAVESCLDSCEFYGGSPSDIDDDEYNGTAG